MEGNINSDLSPIILFVYNRPKETRNTIETLKRNKLAKKSNFYIFSDAAKNEDSLKKVKKVREIINNVSGFKKIEIYEAKENKGLANSVIEGVTKIIEKYGKVIVLEDDLVCSEDYLEYMNEALEVYESNNLIWSISGYNPPLDIPNNYTEDIYLSPRGCSWGWATWKDRWEKVNWKVSNFEKLKKNKKKRREFEQGGSDMYKMLELQILGKIDSWAIRWCYAQYKEKMYTVYPCKSKIKNDGVKAGGTHANGEDSRWKTELNNNGIHLPQVIEANNGMLEVFKRYQDLDWIGKVGYTSKKYGFYDTLKRYKKYFRK